MPRSSPAATRRTRTDDLIDEIITYIRRELNRTRQTNPKAVACPPQEEWAKLAAGSRPTLPGGTLLSLYATPALWGAARRLGGINQAYFAEAQKRLAENRKNAT